MINGLGVMGWGVGGIQAQAVMLGQPISMVLPQVVGFRLDGQLPTNATSTDLVLNITNILRKVKVVGKFVEFTGPGLKYLTLADRATIANMAPQYGATMGFFPFDDVSLKYMEDTKRPSQIIKRIQVLKQMGLYNNSNLSPHFTQNVTLDLSTIKPTISGPKRPHDMIYVSDLKTDFTQCLSATQGFKGFGLSKQKIKIQKKIKVNNDQVTIKNGSIVIAAITSCTNTSNPGVMLAAGMVAKKAIQLGMTVQPHIKTSLSPGSGVVTKYLNQSGLTNYLDQLGFTTAGYGCMTCIGNSGDLDPAIVSAINQTDAVVAAVLSGNRNFQARIHPNVKANYLASPPLVVLYALAGTVDINLQTDVIGKDKNGKDVFMKDLFPLRNQVDEILKKSVKPQMFQQFYSNVLKGGQQWQKLPQNKTQRYGWKQSLYIHNPPFFQTMNLQLPKIQNIQKARCLAFFGDSITTDHISPAGSIQQNSPAGKFLVTNKVQKKDFNTYGARRGNDDVMARGTFANTRIINKMHQKIGPYTNYQPSNQSMFISDAAFKYKENNIPSIVLAGSQYGSGSSRDWAAKGPYILGVKAVIAKSYQRIHRSNLAGMGILPLQFLQGQSAQSLGLNGTQQFKIDIGQLSVNSSMTVTAIGNKTTTFKVKSRLDTQLEIEYFKNGGILHYVMRKLVK